MISSPTLAVLGIEARTSEPVIVAPFVPSMRPSPSMSFTNLAFGLSSNTINWLSVAPSLPNSSMTVVSMLVFAPFLIGTSNLILPSLASISLPSGAMTFPFLPIVNTFTSVLWSGFVMVTLIFSFSLLWLGIFMATSVFSLSLP